MERLHDELDFMEKRMEGWQAETKRLEKKYGIRYSPKIHTREEVGL
jgi:hypothetical protein